MPRPLFAVLTAVAILLLVGRAAVTVCDADISDFRCFYEAGRVVREGLDPYDRAVWAAAPHSEPERLPPCDPTFIYPAWYILRGEAPSSAQKVPAWSDGEKGRSL